MANLTTALVDIRVGSRFELQGVNISQVLKVPEKDEVMVILQEDLLDRSALGFTDDLGKINPKLGEHYINSVYDSTNNLIHIFQVIN